MHYKISFRKTKYNFQNWFYGRCEQGNVENLEQDLVKNQNSKEKMQMETRIEKMSLETLGAVERERERESLPY